MRLGDSKKATDFFTSFGRGRATKKHIYHFCGDFLFGEKTRERLPGPQGPWFFHQPSWPFFRDSIEKMSIRGPGQNPENLPGENQVTGSFPFDFPQGIFVRESQGSLYFQPQRCYKL